jgi:hypothetical protein
MMEDSWPLPTLRKYSAYGLEKGSMHNFMFSMRVKMRISHHKIERERVAETIVT